MYFNTFLTADDIIEWSEKFYKNTGEYPKIISITFANNVFVLFAYNNH